MKRGTKRISRYIVGGVAAEEMVDLELDVAAAFLDEMVDFVDLELDKKE